MDRVTLETAHKLQLEGKLDEAEKQYVAILNRNWDNAILLQYLGCLYIQQQKNGLAMAVLRRSLEFDDKMPETWNNLGLAYRNEYVYDKAKSCYHKAIALTKNNDKLKSNFISNLASIHINEGDAEKGLPWATQSLELNPSNVECHWNLALIHLEMGNFRDGFSAYEWGLLVNQYGKSTRHVREYGWTHEDGTVEPTPWWDGSHGKTVVVYGEQGIGDEIMFASCLSDLEKVCKEVILDCHPRLINIFAKSFPNIKLHGTRKDDEVLWRDEHHIDYKLAIGSLPYWFRRDGFPKHNGYLKADPLPKSSRPKIGIGWVGGSKTTRIELRSMHLKWLRPILEQDADFYSLQYTDHEAEIQQFEKEEGIALIRTGQEKALDYKECADLVAGLDLVIAVNTSVVHLAGSLGVPCWTLTPNKPAWRYGIKGSEMPWYPSVRQFRQGDEDWGQVINRVSEELRAYLARLSRTESKTA